jgi:hypothetical protein
MSNHTQLKREALRYLFCIFAEKPMSLAPGYRISEVSKVVHGPVSVAQNFRDAMKMFARPGFYVEGVSLVETFNATPKAGWMSTRLKIA